MTPTWSLEQLLADPQLTREQIEMLDAEDRANGIQMVRVTPGVRWHDGPDPAVIYAIRLQAAREQLEAVRALQQTHP